MQAKERLSCLNDVRTTLASVLQELGLKARLRPRADGLGIIFESEDRLVCSPVTLDLSGSLGPSTEIWHRAGLTWQYYERRPASDNGWIYDKVMLGCRDYIPLAGHDISKFLRRPYVMPESYGLRIIHFQRSTRMSPRHTRT